MQIYPYSVFRIPTHRCHSIYRFFFDKTENGTDRAPIACHCCGFITCPLPYSRLTACPLLLGERVYYVGPGIYGWARWTD